VQASTDVSDDEVIEATTMDRRWQLVLDGLDCTTPLFSKATLVAFRQWVIAHDSNRHLIERALEVAKESGLFTAPNNSTRPDEVDYTGGMTSRCQRTALAGWEWEIGHGTNDNPGLVGPPVCR
jgi:hypothetical protein